MSNLAIYKKREFNKNSQNRHNCLKYEYFESRQIWLYIEEKNLKIKNSPGRLNCQKFESVLKIFFYLHV